MARRRGERSAADIKLKQPDRSGPTEKTLLQLAEERGLFAQAKQREDEIAKKATRIPIPRPKKDGDEDEDDESGLSPTAERVLETLLWSMSIAMLHFTLDVLVQHQYSIDRIVWSKVCMRFVQALLGELGSPLSWSRQRRVADPDFVASSLRSSRLLPPSPRRKPRAGSRAVSSISVCAPASHILHHEHCCRLLFDPHHQHVWLLGRHETITSDRLPLGLVRH
jgi:hypothetical protein